MTKDWDHPPYQGREPETFPSYPYLDVARRTGVDYGVVLKAVSRIESNCVDNRGKPFIWVTKISGLPQLSENTVVEIVKAFYYEQRRRELVLLEAGTA